MPIIRYLIILLTGSIFFLSSEAFATLITNYKPVEFFATQGSKTFLITREFEVNGIKKYLAINTSTFSTSILLNITPASTSTLADFSKIFNLSPLTHSNHVNTIYLTVDMCQSSKKGFEEDFFKSLIAYGKSHHKPINVGISLTALWALHHEKEFTKLKTWEKDNDLHITWVNHSYYHYYNPKLPNDQNFMIHDGKYAKEDIIKNEIFMLKNNITPSVFFRFPGLIYNQYLLNQLKTLHLIPVDAGAWLAKTKGVFKGSDIILVHGNLNEHYGVELFLKALKAGKFDNYQFGQLTDILKDAATNKK